MGDKVLLALTARQRAALRPFFDAIRTLNAEGDSGAIGAQIYEDGIVCKVFAGKQGRALSKALGGHWDETNTKAAQRMARP